MRRRFNIVPFDRKPACPDPQLEEKLKAEWPAILRWMIDGCADWQANGLIRPQSVLHATAAYFAKQDVFGQWLEDECVVEPEQPAPLRDRPATSSPHGDVRQGGRRGARNGRIASPRTCSAGASSARQRRSGRRFASGSASRCRGTRPMSCNPEIGVTGVTGVTRAGGVTAGHGAFKSHLGSMLHGNVPISATAPGYTGYTNSSTSPIIGHTRARTYKVIRDRCNRCNRCNRAVRGGSPSALRLASALCGPSGAVHLMATDPPVRAAVQRGRSGPNAAASASPVGRGGTYGRGHKPLPPDFSPQQPVR